MGVEDLQRQIEADELADGLELGEVTKMTPRDYAKYRSKKTGMKLEPQMVYYYIRKGKLVPDWCECGRKVVVIEEADALFDSIEEKKGI